MGKLTVEEIERYCATARNRIDEIFELSGEKNHEKHWATIMDAATEHIECIIGRVVTRKEMDLIHSHLAHYIRYKEVHK